MATLPELPRRLRSLVDTCFEESLYDAGIGILDKIRTPNAGPSQAHIRQLLYLVLYPPSTKAPEIKKPAPKRKRRTAHDVPEVAPPDAEVVELALDTLHHILRTNSVHDVLGVIPSYETTFEVDNTDFIGNPLAYHATCIAQAKHCWEILSPNFIIPEGRELISSNQSSPVADHAWPVFEWLVDAFEKDGKGGVSKCLASQLPKSSGGPRMVLDAPLDVIFTAFTPPNDPRRMEVGMRLLKLLISLTRSAPPLVSPDRLVSETTRRLTDTSLASHEAFVARLEESHFRTAVAILYLEQNGSTRVDNKSYTADKTKSRSHRTFAESRNPTSHSLPSVERMLDMIELEHEIESGEEDKADQPQEGRLKYTLMKLQLLGTINKELAADKAVNKMDLLRERVDKGFPKQGGHKAMAFRRDALACID